MKEATSDHSASHLPPQSPRLQEAAHLLSQLVGNYDADTLCDACLRLAETIEQGLLQDLVETLDKDGTGGDGTSSVCFPRRKGGYGGATLSILGIDVVNGVC